MYTTILIRIRGFDPDGDSLTFGVVGDQNLVQVEQIDSEQADVVLLRFKLETNYFHKMLENTFFVFYFFILLTESWITRRNEIMKLFSP